MAKEKDDRRSQELAGLDIDRRRMEARREAQRRPWLSKAYEEIYISAYVNAVYPRFPSKVHAFSNVEGEEELSSAEWVVANLGVSDATAKQALRSLSSFAQELIKSGLVVDETGKVVIVEKTVVVQNATIDKYLLKTGT